MIRVRGLPRGTWLNITSGGDIPALVIAAGRRGISLYWVRGLGRAWHLPPLKSL